MYGKLDLKTELKKCCSSFRKGLFIHVTAADWNSRQVMTLCVKTDFVCFSGEDFMWFLELPKSRAQNPSRCGSRVPHQGTSQGKGQLHAEIQGNLQLQGFWGSWNFPTTQVAVCQDLIWQGTRKTPKNGEIRAADIKGTTRFGDNYYNYASCTKLLD